MRNFQFHTKLLLGFAFLMSFFGYGQCPQVLDGNSNPSSHPYWIHCAGTDYVLKFQSPNSWGTYTISWGDASADYTDVNYVANTVIQHTYSATVDTFIVTLMIPSQSCTMTGVVVMEQAVVAGVGIPVSATTAACSPATFSLSNTSYNTSNTTHYKWEFGDGSPAVFMTYTNTNQIVTHLYSSANVTCQTQATLTAWNYCSGAFSSTAASVPLYVFDKDVASITTSAITKCTPDNIFTFTNTSQQNCDTQGNTYQRYQYWNLGNYWSANNFQDSILNWSVFPPASTASVAFPGNGNYTVTLLDSNICGIDTATIAINIFTKPTASVIAPPAPLCQNTSITFTSLSSAGALYKWNFGETPPYVSTGPGNQNYTYTTSSTYTVTHVAYLPFHNSCYDTSQVVVVINPLPVADFTVAPDKDCDTLSNVYCTDNSTGATSWNWDFGNSNTSTAQIPPDQTYTVVGTHVITLTVTAPGGCTSIAQHTVQVNPSPTVNFAFNPTVCINSLVNFTNSSASSPTLPITSYTWDMGDASATYSIQNPSHTYTSSSIFTITLTASNAECSTSKSSTVLVNSNPSADFVMSPTAGCTPLAVSFTNASLGNTECLWNFGDASPTSTACNTSHTYTTTFPANQTQTVTLYVTSVDGCIDSISKTIVQYANPVPNFTQTSLSGCSPLAVTFTNTSGTYSSAVWDFDNGSSSTQTIASTSYTNSAGDPDKNYQVKLILTSVDGCKDSLLKTLTLLQRPKAVFLADTPVCANKLVTFTNSSLGASTYTWTFGSSGTSNSISPSVQFLNPLSSIQYSLTQLAVTNSVGCTDTLKWSIGIYSAPDYNFTMSKDSGCTTLNVIFQATSGLSSYNWDFGNGKTANVAVTSIGFDNTTSSAVIYTVQFTGRDSYGCGDTVQKQIKVFPKPVANFEFSPGTVFLPDANVQFTDLSTDATSFTWAFGDGGSSNNQNPSYLYQTANEYDVMLIVKSDHGCLDTTYSSTKVLVLDDTYFQIPSAFTPNTNGSPGSVYSNSDLSNDIFHAHLKGVVEFRLTVYSRWGEVMFDSDKLDEGWDGYYKGKLCPADVYMWKARLKLTNGQVIDKKGDVELLR